MDFTENDLKTLEFDKILATLSTFAKTEQSKNLCLSLNISQNINIIKEQLQYTKEAKAILDEGLELPIGFVYDIQKIIQSTLGSYLQEEEIFNVGKTIESSRLVKNFIKNNSEKESLLNTIALALYSDKDFEDRIFETFDSNLNVKPDATPELSALNNSLKDSETNLKTRVNELLNDANFSKHLQEQIYTTRDDRVVFQVKASSKSKIDGIIHDISASNQSFYIEPKQIVPLNNKIREVKSKIYQEIINILTDLTKEIRKNIEEIRQTEDILAQIDFHFTKARYANKLNAVEPEITTQKYLKFIQMKHPLLCEYKKDVIANNFEIGNGYKSIIITGSNTGGKTVLIKTIGLFVLMTKAGLFLPCHEAKVYPFKNIFADIGDEQNIAQSLSTFSSHMKNIIRITENSNEETLILLDEICAGTDPQEGCVLAQVILEDLAKKGATTCVTTHFGELKGLEYSNTYFKNACVEFDSETLKPTYKLIIGIPGLSNAILISDSLGLNKQLITKAKEIVSSQKDPSFVVVEKLQDMQQKLSKNLAESEQLNKDALEAKKEYDKKLSELKKDKKKTIKSLRDKFDTEIEETKGEIKDILKQMRKEKSEKIARRSYARLAKLEKNFNDKANSENESENYTELAWENIKIGDKVLLKDLHQSVEILSLPDKSGKVFVQMGFIKTKIDKEKLAFLEEKYLSKPTLRFYPKESCKIERINMSNTLDLRGYRVEEALDSLEYFLDKASLANLTPVYVIHGHGTGALKNAVQDFLSTSPYVAKYRFGEAEEGGDGISVIDIN